MQNYGSAENFRGYVIFQRPELPVNKKPHLNYLRNPETVRSRRTVVDQVHEILLDAIKSGELRAGDPLHDQT